MFPEKEELKLKGSVDTSTTELLKELRKFLHETEVKASDLEKVVNSNLEKFYDELVERSFEFSKYTEDQWKEILDTDIVSADIKSSESWIKENLSIYVNTPKKAVDKLNKLRADRIDRYRIDFNKGFNTRIEQGRFTKADIEYIKAKAFQKDGLTYKEREYIERLGYKLDQLNQFSSDDMEKLKEWMYRRNELWSRDQAGDIYAQQCEELSLRNGIEEFIWFTEADKRVRPTHWHRHGKRFRFDSVDYLPGQEQLCRCWMKPIRRK